MGSNQDYMGHKCISSYQLANTFQTEKYGKQIQTSEQNLQQNVSHNWYGYILDLKNQKFVVNRLKVQSFN